MKLNLGCGLHDLREGYVNVDQRLIDLPAPRGVEFVHLDLTVMPWPFHDGTVSEILMLDVLEHFPMSQTAVILSQCWRVLEAHGELVIQVPDAAKLAKSIVQDDLDGHTCLCRGTTHPGMTGCAQCGRSQMQIACDARMRLFGGQDYPGNFHQTCFTRLMLFKEVGEAGFQVFTDEQSLAGDHWNMRFRFRRST